VAQEAEPLEQQTAEDASKKSKQNGLECKQEELAHNRDWGGRCEFKVGFAKQVLYSVEQNNGDDIVEHSFSVDD